MLWDPPSYMRSVIDRNVVICRMTVLRIVTLLPFQFNGPLIEIYTYCRRSKRSKWYHYMRQARAKYMHAASLGERNELQHLTMSKDSTESFGLVRALSSTWSHLSPSFSHFYCWGSSLIPGGIKRNTTDLLKQPITDSAKWSGRFLKNFKEWNGRWRH
jgi:hypothetical protein